MATTTGDLTIRVSPDESAASRDLVDQPLARLQMRDHGGEEKTGRLPSELPLDGRPRGADPDFGAVGCYASGGELVRDFGRPSYLPGIVVLGATGGDAAARLAKVDGAVTGTVETAR